MTDHDDSFDPELSSLLRSADPEAPPPAARARLGARLEQAVVAASVAGVAGVVGVAASHAASSLRAKLTLVAAGLVLGGGAGSVITYGVLASRPAQIVYVERAPVASTAAPPAPPEYATPPVEAPSPSAAPAPSSAPSQVASSEVAPVTSATFAAERRLLDDARTAYMRGDDETALAKLESHAAQFSKGRLAEEREALAIRVLVHAGRTREARARGKAFEARYPSSLMLPAVQAALRSIDQPNPNP